MLNLNIKLKCIFVVKVYFNRANEEENKIEHDDNMLEQASYHLDTQSTPIIVATAEPVFY